jgi:putative radical SAM enzyme (TIGR03279 family)
MLEILAVAPGSIAAELELEAGDCLLAINGRPVRDLLDFLLDETDEELLLEIRKRSGELWDLELDKDAGQPLGLEFEHPQPTQCGNNCIFCFVHQLPRGMRPSLYVKDEDFRFSYLYGSYVTLSNVSEADVRRIVDRRLSPLYVSVHATEDRVRQEMLGRSGPSILELLRRLTAEGIEVHAQIVLCPGINDDVVLDRSIADLQALYPGVRSLAVVPVGLTGYRQRLPALRPPDQAEAVAIIERIHDCQQRFRKAGGSRFVFAADEFYLRAEREIPGLAAYEDLPQLENGVGLLARFRAAADEALREARPLECGPVAMVTGVSAAAEVERFVAALGAATGVAMRLFTVTNRFFGGHVSVTGLLTGADLLAALRGQELGVALLLPAVMLREGDELLLDDLSLADLERELGVPVRVIDDSPWGLLHALEDLADESAGQDPAGAEIHG